MASPTNRSASPRWGLGNRSIRTQLAILVLVATLPAFVAAIWHLTQDRIHHRQVALERLRLLVDNTADRLQSSLAKHKSSLALIAERPMVKAMDRGACDPVISDLVWLNPEFLTMGIRDLDGNAVCSHRPDPPGIQQFREFPWFKPAMAVGSTHVSDLFFAPLAQRWSTVLTTPVRGQTGEASGLVVLPLDLLDLNEKVMKSIPPDVLVSVLDSQFRIMLRSSDVAAWISKPVSDDLAQLRAAAETAPNGVVTVADATGVRRILAFQRLPLTDWTVIAGLPEADVFADAGGAMRSGILGSVALLVAALLLAWRIARSIGRPLEAMATTTARIAAGDTLARMSIQHGAPEVFTLAKAFDQMLHARRQSEQALRDSEENLAITLLSIGDAVIATDARGRITRMNPVAERMTGWTLDQALGRPLADVFRIVHAVTREVPQDPVARVLASGQVVGLANHTALLARDGSELQISDSAAPIRDALGQLVGVVLVFSDVTEPYRLQQVLIESEGRYRALVDSSPVGVVVHQHQRLVFVNPSAARALGALDIKALMGRQLSDFVAPDQHPLLAQRAQQLQDDPTNLPMTEWRCLRLDGTEFDVQAQATAIRLKGASAVQVSFIEITERKRAQAGLRENEARFRALTSLSSDWYWEQDAQFRYIQVDGGMSNWSDNIDAQFVGASYVGKKRWELGDTSLTPAQWDAHREALNTHQEFRGLEMRLAKGDGSFSWASVSGTPIFDAQGVFCGYRGIGREITASKLAEEQINALAFYDALTELPNRRLLIEQLKQALPTHARNHQRAALLFIDLDNFKTLNDTLGHETGDLLLMQVARRLLACVREADTVARFGGDEFVVMLQGLSAEPVVAAADAELVGNKILAAFVPPFLLSGREYRGTTSIGITLFGDDSQGMEDLLKQADLAMYQAKAAGRNTLRLFDQGMQAAVDARVALESDLRHALAVGQFLLHYQPVVGSGGLVSGAEALLRWQHPARGLVSPAHFIPLAESTRLIVPLGLWVLNTACAQLAAWSTREATRSLTLAVNVSVHQFMAPDFVSQVLAALARNGADPAHLKLELTESLLADKIETVIGKMMALRARGVNFSLDDFGTGYSSLRYLKLLPLSHLKIDQSFVRDLLVDPNDAAIARTIVALGASLGLAVIAEGVEADGQFEFLLAIGCHAFQGYLFARPVPIAEFEALLPGPLAPR